QAVVDRPAADHHVVKRRRARGQALAGGARAGEREGGEAQKADGAHRSLRPQRRKRAQILSGCLASANFMIAAESRSQTSVGPSRLVALVSTTVKGVVMRKRRWRPWKIWSIVFFASGVGGASFPPPPIWLPASETGLPSSLDSRRVLPSSTSFK